MFNNEYDILTPEETMDYLNIGRNTLYHLLNSGKLKGFRIGRNWKIPRKSLDEYVEQNLISGNKRK